MAKWHKPSGHVLFAGAPRLNYHIGGACTGSQHRHNFAVTVLEASIPLGQFICRLAHNCRAADISPITPVMSRRVEVDDVTLLVTVGHIWVREPRVVTTPTGHVTTVAILLRH